MVSKISDDADKVVADGDKFAAASGGSNFGILASSIATYIFGKIAALTNKTIAATANTLTRPYFSVNLSANQSATSTVSTKVAFDTEVHDSNGWYDNVTNFRFTPQLAGKWRFSAEVLGFGATITTLDINIFKNGAAFARSLRQVSVTSNSTSVEISKIIDMNGSTDYVEIFVTATGSALLFAGGTAPVRTWFEGSFVSS